MNKALIISENLVKQDEQEFFRDAFSVPNMEFLFAGSDEDVPGILEEDHTVRVLLMDIDTDGNGTDDGLAGLSRLREKGVTVPVLIMGRADQAENLLRAWEMGAQGFIRKNVDPNELKGEFVQKLSRFARVSSSRPTSAVESFKARIKSRAVEALKGVAHLSMDDIVAQARGVKEYLGVDWAHSVPFPSDFQNYVRGWNETDEVLREAEANHRLLYLNMDFGDGCALKCPHCFTMDGAIDARGRDQMAFERVKESILEAKELGLRHVRILGRGEPTQWIAKPGKQSGPNDGEDLIDFIKFLHSNDITPLIFSRGHVLGDEQRIAFTFDGAHGVNSSQDLVRLLADNGASIFLGVSSIFPEINDQMVGVPKTANYNYDDYCRRSLKLLVDAGFNASNPTRLATEMPITNLNIREMPIRYVLFQCLNISPCTNVYMMTGRAMTYGLGEITDPPQEQFLDYFGMVLHFARRMGIDLRIGPYAGTKECHDVSAGMYLTLNGDIYPCTGYEGVHNLLGSARKHSVRDVWENNPFGGHKQSICPPKIGTHFPPGFERDVEETVQRNRIRYDEMFYAICQGLGVSVN